MEQLVAESTGKDGVGLVPVVDEPPLPPDLPRPADRLWVYLRLSAADNAATDARVASLVAAGEPVIALSVPDAYALGAEFYRWEFATAIAGRLLGVNPFDQPDVDSAKRQAQQALDRYEETRSLSEETPLLEEGTLALYGPPRGAGDVVGYLAAFLGDARPGDYAALLAYIERSAEHAAVLEGLAARMRAALGIPVTIGFGPRFLHSTGQLHKGGPDTGLFLQITPTDARDLPIPGSGYSFGVLKRAQAIGDLNALRDAGRRVVRVDIGEDVAQGLAALDEALVAALARRAAS
jgi:transaldolase/glucose-6-phosphate isomerase